ncbi:MAG: hypothetical protein GXO86_09995 [Chlorobi bacterium]|nr:hypothetical protein [Chlorobiota bacterium]
MKTTDLNSKFINNYFDLIKNLSLEQKLDIIEKLTKTIKGDIVRKTKTLKKAFGAWKSEKSADEIINELRNSRHFNRHIDIKIEGWTL